MLKSMTLRASIVVFACAASAAAHAIADTPKAVNVRPGALTDAIEALAKQCAVDVIYPSGQLRGFETNGVVGVFETREAFGKLIEGTPLILKQEGTSVLITLPRNPDAASPAPQPQTTESKPSGGTQQTAAREAQKKSFWDRFRVAQVDQGTVQPGMTNSAATGDEQLPPSRAIEEIIVTAQKREERLQDVPISISVLDGDALDRSTAQGVTDMLARVPGVAVSVAAQAAGTLIAVRGVTAPGGFNVGSSPVGYYLDSVPFGFVRTAIVPDVDVYDLDRIEVLRGPQGTLYGAGSQNGVVRVLTREANLTDFELKGRASYSRTDSGGDNAGADAAINVPLIEGKLAVRAVAGYEDLSGWIDKPTRADANDARLRNGRLKVNAQPTDELSIGLSAWVSRSDFGAPSTSLDNERSSSVDAEQMEHDFNSYGLRIGYDFSSFSLTSATSYIEYLNDGDNDLTPAGIPVLQRTRLTPETFAQEINLNSTRDGPWRWSLGGIYRDGEDRLFQTRTGVTFPQSVLFGSESWAAFGELTRSFFDGRLELTAGLRHFEDTVTTQEEARFGNAPQPAQLVSREADFHATTPRVILTWHPYEQSMIYASYAEGFRSGFDQIPAVLAAAPSLTAVDPDLLKNYEVGTKGSLWGGRFSYETAVYYIDWQDVQLPLAVLVDGQIRSAAVNGPSASGGGVDAALNAAVGEHLELGVTYSWNDLSVDEDVFSGGVLLYEKGERLNLSSEYTVGASLSYTFPIGDGGLEGRFSLSGNLTSRLNTTALVGTSRVISYGDSIGVSRASFLVDSPHHWSAALFVDNLNNEDGAVLRGSTPAFTPHLRPRTVGLQFDYQF